jgi:hypothetical protein
MLCGYCPAPLEHAAARRDDADTAVGPPRVSTTSHAPDIVQRGPFRAARYGTAQWAGNHP